MVQPSTVEFIGEKREGKSNKDTSNPRLIKEKNLRLSEDKEKDRENEGKKKEEVEDLDEKLPALSAHEFRQYNKLAERMDYFVSFLMKAAYSSLGMFCAYPSPCDLE